MSQDLEKIDRFLQEHHVLSLATSDGDDLSVCSLFYSYSLEKNLFVVASSEETTHMQHIAKNNKVAGNILLETKSVGKIQGVQFRGNFFALEDENSKKKYFSLFPHAKLMNPLLWQIKINYFKMTDNRLGFGKKIIWKDSLLQT